MSKQGSNSELFAHENDALTARPQLHKILWTKYQQAECFSHLSKFTLGLFR